jgi:hypothetical protein
VFGTHRSGLTLSPRLVAGRASSSGFAALAWVQRMVPYLFPFTQRSCIGSDCVDPDFADRRQFRRERSRDPFFRFWSTTRHPVRLMKAFGTVQTAEFFHVECQPSVQSQETESMKAISKCVKPGHKSVNLVLAQLLLPHLT